MLLQMMTGVSELVIWLALISAIAVPSIAWGVLSTKLNNIGVRVDQQDKVIAEMKHEFTQTSIQLARITTLLEQKVLSSIDELKISVKEHATRAEHLMDDIIKFRENDKKGNS